MDFPSLTHHRQMLIHLLSTFRSMAFASRMQSGIDHDKQKQNHVIPRMIEASRYGSALKEAVTNRLLEKANQLEHQSDVSTAKADKPSEQRIVCKRCFAVSDSGD